MSSTTLSVRASGSPPRASSRSPSGSPPAGPRFVSAGYRPCGFASCERSSRSARAARERVSGRNTCRSYGRMLVSRSAHHPRYGIVMPAVATATHRTASPCTDARPVDSTLFANAVGAIGSRERSEALSQPSGSQGLDRELRGGRADRSTAGPRDAETSRHRLRGDADACGDAPARPRYERSRVGETTSRCVASRPRRGACGFSRRTLRRRVRATTCARSRSSPTRSMGTPRIISDPPLIVPIEELAGESADHAIELFARGANPGISALSRTIGAGSSGLPVARRQRRRTSQRRLSLEGRGSVGAPRRRAPPARRPRSAPASSSPRAGESSPRDVKRPTLMQSAPTSSRLGAAMTYEAVRLVVSYVLELDRRARPVREDRNVQHAVSGTSDRSARSAIRRPGPIDGTRCDGSSTARSAFAS